VRHWSWSSLSLSTLQIYCKPQFLSQHKKPSSQSNTCCKNSPALIGCKNYSRHHQGERNFQSIIICTSPSNWVKMSATRQSNKTAGGPDDGLRCILCSLFFLLKHATPNPLHTERSVCKVIAVWQAGCRRRCSYCGVMYCTFSFALIWCGLRRIWWKVRP
jgi:hypothetical protein